MKNWSEINQWRRERRAELVAARATLENGRRDSWGKRISELLEAGFHVPAGTVIGFCWPYKNEFDARFVVRRCRDRGAVAALPAVVGKARPLQFRKWWPGATMQPGVNGIPEPDDTEILLPDVALVPMNGFDEQGYRLGYGGGYFDRTLAALERRVLAIGIGYEILRMPTIHPQPHDIPMDFVVTEKGSYRAGGKKLAPLSAAQFAAATATLLEVRRLPRHRLQIPPSPAAGYSSPACYAHEFAPDRSEVVSAMPVKEVVALLDTLLEAERAGAKTVAAYLEDYERDSPPWRQLAVVQRDEAKNCSILIDLIRRLGGKPSSATGSFLEKALLVRGTIARLRFLNRGQKWVTRRINEALPRLEQDFVCGALFAMQESHLLNIELCDALVETLEGRSGTSRAPSFS